MKLTLSFSIHGSDKPVQLYQFKHWWEIGRDVPSSRPEVNPLTPLDAFPFTEEWQWFAYKLLDNQNDGRLTHEKVIQAFSSLYSSTTAFCNGNGVESYRNYITGNIYSEHRLLPLPKVFPIITGGNVVTGEEAVIKDIHYLRVEHLEGTPNYDITKEKYPWLIQYATQIYTTKVGDGYVVGRFPQMAGLDVPVPLLMTGDVFYPLANLNKLPLGSSIPSPYNP
jgi:hypothetical protein